MKSYDIIFDDDVKKVGERVRDGLSEIYKKINDTVGKEVIKVKKLGIYYTYPYLFIDDFKKIEDEKMYMLCLAGAIYSDLTFINDDFIDEASLKNEDEMVFVKDLLVMESVRILSSMFDKDSEFWDYFYKYNQEFIHSNIAEKNKRINDEYTYDEYCMNVRGKSAISKIATAAMGCLTRQYDKINAMEISQDLIAEANQLFDDLVDWKKDFELKRPSWVINSIIKDNSIDAETNIDNIRTLLFNGGYLEKILCMIRKCCAKSLLKNGMTDAWETSIRLLQDRAEYLQRDLLEIKGDKRYLPQYYNYDDNAESVDVNKIVDFINDQKKSHFLELAHKMIFPHSIGFTAKRECVEGTFFQKSYFLNRIYDLNINNDLKFVSVKDEAENLVGYISEFFDYGWGYFPELPELCPDIDTLSEIIKLTVNYGLEKISKERIDKTIDIALSSNKRCDRAFRTWILPEKDENAIIKKARICALERWGNDYDLEVNLNFFMALYIWDSKKYADIINDGLGWIKDNFVNKNCFASTWYCSEFYTCFLAAKFFKLVNSDDDVLRNKIIEHVVSNINDDGTWGDNCCKLTDNAYAIYVLYLLDEEKKYKEYVKKALDVIEKNYERDGYWYSEYFIKMDTGRVGGMGKIFTYQSTLITTVDVLNGYLAGKKYIEE